MVVEFDSAFKSLTVYQRYAHRHDATPISGDWSELEVDITKQGKRDRY